MWTCVYVACRLLGYLVPLCVVWTKCGDINRAALARSLFHALCALGCCHCHLLHFHSVTIWCPPLLCAWICRRLPTDYTPKVQPGGKFVFLHSTSPSLLTVDWGELHFAVVCCWHCLAVVGLLRMNLHVLDKHALFSCALWPLEPLCSVDVMCNCQLVVDIVGIGYRMRHVETSWHIFAAIHVQIARSIVRFVRDQ